MTNIAAITIMIVLMVGTFMGAALIIQDGNSNVFNNNVSGTQGNGSAIAPLIKTGATSMVDITGILILMMVVFAVVILLVMFYAMFAR